MYLGKVGNIRSANAWLAYSADTPAPHTLEFLLMFHFVIFSEKSSFTVFGKIHIYILIYILHFWTSGNACVSPFPFDVTARISAFYFAYVHIEYLLVTHIGHFAGICIWTLAWMSTSGLCQLLWLLCMCTGIHPIGKKRRDKKTTDTNFELVLGGGSGGVTAMTYSVLISALSVSRPTVYLVYVVYTL